MEFIRRLISGLLMLLIIAGVAIVSVTALFVIVALIVGLLFVFGLGH